MSRRSAEAAVVILAGGGSRRMGGRPKAFLEVGGREILERLLTDATAGFRDVIVAAGRQEVRPAVGDRPSPLAAALLRYGWRPARGSDRRFERRDGTGRAVRLVTDRLPEAGPVAGLQAGLEAVDASLVWVLACDLPFVTPALGLRLLAAVPRGEGSEEPACAVPLLAGRRQPLCAAYSASVAAVAARLLERGGGSMHELLERLRVTELAPGALAELGDPDRLLLNVNLPEDLARARRRAGG